MDLIGVIQNLIVSFLGNGLKIVLILIGSVIINSLLKSFVKKVFENQLKDIVEDEGKKQRIKVILNALNDMVKGFVWIVAVLMILSELEVETAPLLTSLGVVGLSISFASKEIIQDFIRGFFIILEDQYRIGDFVKIAGIEGVVKSLNFRTTILKSEDDILHIIPNREIKIISKKK